MYAGTGIPRTTYSNMLTLPKMRRQCYIILWQPRRGPGGCVWDLQANVGGADEA